MVRAPLDGSRTPMPANSGIYLLSTTGSPTGFALVVSILITIIGVLMFKFADTGARQAAEFWSDSHEEQIPGLRLVMRVAGVVAAVC